MPKPRIIPKKVTKSSNKASSRKRSSSVSKDAWTKKLGPWQSSVPMPAFAGRVLQAISTRHHMTGYAYGVSSAGAINTPLTYRFHPSLNTSATTNFGPTMNWSTVTNNSWGSELYGVGYVNTERYFLHDIKFRIIVQQVQENGRVRICFANPTGRTQQIPTLRYNWNPNVYQMQNDHYWQVVKQYDLNFDQTNPDPAVSRLRANREMLITIPVNKWFNQKTGVAAASASSWDAVDWNQEFYMFIDTDDVTSVDSETFETSIYIDHTFSVASS